jgi:class 3 adenylate cyclase
VSESTVKSFRAPDEVVRLPKMTADIVVLGELTMSRLVAEPGWRWSEHVRPRYVVGDEPCVQIFWAGNRPFFASFLIGSRTRVLATLLFTDLVDSTAKAAELGDARWRALLSDHFVGARGELERYGGREVKTTGDGLLATFDSPGQALRCAAAIRGTTNRAGLQIRAGVHVGEVEVVGEDVRGVTVHEAARIMAAAGADEILVSDLTRALTGAAGLTFEDRGTHALKGLDGEWRLAAYLSE